MGGASDDLGEGVAVDAEGNVYVAGDTRSRRWVSGGYNTITTTTASKTHSWSSSARRVRMSGPPTWAGELENGWGIAVDHSTNVLVVGSTESSGWISGGFSTSYHGGRDAFVVKLSGDGALLWSSYLGGGAPEEGWSVAADGSDNVLVAGETQSAGWAQGVSGTSYFGTTFNGGIDGFVAKLTPAGSNLWTTYLGGSAVDTCRRIATDSTDNILAVGSTASANWISGGYDTNYNGGEDVFAAKLNPAGTPLWSTYVGGQGDDFDGGLAVDSAGDIFLSGQTFSFNWVLGDFDTVMEGAPDGFVAKISAAGMHLWSSYLGGSNREGCTGVAVDGSGNLFVSGWTTSSDWLSAISDTTYHGDVDPFVVKLRDSVRPPAPALGHSGEPVADLRNRGQQLVSDVGLDFGAQCERLCGARFFGFRLHGLADLHQPRLPSGSDRRQCGYRGPPDLRLERAGFGRWLELLRQRLVKLLFFFD